MILFLWYKVRKLGIDAKEAEAHFTISKTNDANHEETKGNKSQNNIEKNPKTNDNIILYISMSILSILGLVGLGLYIKQRKRVN